VIRVQELSKRYGDLLALDRLDFELGRGEILGLLGPNGAGKTTTLRLLTGFMPPDAGRVTLDDRDLRDLGQSLRHRSGYLPEANPHYPELTLRENLEFWGALYGLGGAALGTAIGRVVEGCGLVGMENRPTRELSKGFRQRLGLAQALIHDPEIVFLDEPTAGLDPLNVRELRGMIRDFAGRKTVVLCTHVLSEVEAVCDRVLILDQGRTVLSGKLSELTGQIGEAVAFELGVSFAGSSDAWQGAPGLRSAEPIPSEAGDETSVKVERWRLELDPDPEAPARLVAWLQGRGDRLYEMRRLRRGLEEVFLNVIDGGRRS
jgi:ABC-2 type transport system ATP-binding protein